MSSKGGRPRTLDIRPGMEMVGGWKILDMDRARVGECIVKCPKCYSPQSRLYSQIAKVMRNINTGLKCSACGYSTSFGHKPKYNVTVGELVGGWLVVGMERNKDRSLWEYRIQCPGCSHIESRDTSHFYTVCRNPSLGFRCSQCLYSSSRCRKQIGFSVGDSVWNFTVLSVPDKGSKSDSAEVAFECKRCKHRKVVTVGTVKIYLRRRGYLPCPACEDEQEKGLEIGGWRITGRVTSGQTKSAWFIVHSCGRERQVHQSQIDKAITGEVPISCRRCNKREANQKARGPKSSKGQLTPWQQKYFAAAMSSRKRTILGTPVQNSIVDLRTEAIETMQMCSRWDDNRCKYEIALLNPRKFEIELRTSFQQYNAGSARI